MSDTTLLIQIVFSSLLILGYSAYLYYIRTKLTAKKLEKKNVLLSNIYGNVSDNLKEKNSRKTRKKSHSSNQKNQS